MEMFVEVLDCDKVSLKPFESILNSKALSFCQYHTNIVFDQIYPNPDSSVWLLSPSFLEDKNGASVPSTQHKGRIKSNQMSFLH